MLTADERVRLVFPVLEGTALEDAAPVGGDGAAVTGSRVAGVPNRIVAVVPAGSGRELAERVVTAVEGLWAGWVQGVHGRLVQTPGMPSVQWVCVPAGAASGYAASWRVGQQALVARRRVRDFGYMEDLGRRVCSLSPRWVAEDRAPEPRRPHERETLSAANWVKRRWRPSSDDRDRIGFPSTSSIASAPFRLAVLRQWDAGVVRDAVAGLQAAVTAVTSTRETPVAALRDAGRGDALARWFVEAAGPWVYRDVWDPGSLWREVGGRREPMPDDFPRRAAAGAGALRRLFAVADEFARAGTPPSYLAVVVQDLDNMGLFLGGEGVARDGRRLMVEPDEHRAVSRRLVELGAAQRQALIAEEILGVPVYAGGDDLLAFSPAATGLAAAAAVHGAVGADLPTASTAVLFFHRASSLRVALVQARALLAEAKDCDAAKHALGVGYLRRSGVRESSVQPWHATSDGDGPGLTAADLFTVFTTVRAGRRLSPRLVTELERDEVELADPSLSDEWYRAELTRLVRRHGGTTDDAVTLYRLGARERAQRSPGTATRRGVRAGGRGVPARAARVAMFLRQECAGTPR